MIAGGIMKYSDIPNYITDIIDNALEFIKKNSYPSDWSSAGVGWQEQWIRETRPGNTAGVYASCEGLLLFRADDAEFDNLKKSVYDNHLIKIFDESVSVAENKKRRVRGHSLFITYKLAHFLRISSYLREEKYKPVVENAMKRLYDNYIPEEWLFAPSNKLEESGRVLATSDALVALHLISEWLPYDKVIFDNCINKFKDILNTFDFSSKNLYTAISTKVIVLWTISYLDQYFDDQTKIVAAKTCIKLANSLKKLKGNRTEIKFSVQYDDADDRDYYTLNVQLELMDALITFIRKGYIAWSTLANIILEEVLELAEIVKKNKFYSTQDSIDKAEFWENYQAVEVLKHCVGLIIDIVKDKESEDKLMVVSPKIFNETVFDQDEKLVFVIMPFKENWSEDVYRGFSDALEPLGYKVLRADEVTKDDMITQTIWELINRSKFIIADCTGKNPNVFYELGLAHAVGKSVFICTQNSSDVSFDLMHIRHYCYKDTSYGNMEMLKKKLKEFAGNV